MQELISSENIHLIERSYKASAKTEFLKNFFAWCERQEENRFFWMGIALFGLIGAVVPITLFAIYLAGNNFNLWIITCAVNVPVLALNLAAQPPKVTLPALFIALLADAVLIAYSLAVFLAV
jgi:hypothetical protein